MTPHVHLHIERLTVEGHAGLDREALATAVQTELTRLLTEQGLPDGAVERTARYYAAGPDIASLPAGPTQTAPTAAHTLGARIARSVHGGLGR